MAMNNARHGGQADAGAFELSRPMEALERAEEFAGVSHVEARAIVAHIERAASVLEGRPELDVAHRPLPGELPGVPQEVLEDDAHQPRVARGFDTVLDAKDHLAVRLTFLELLGDLSGEVAEADRAAPELGARQARQVEEAVDQLPHPLGRCQDPL